MAWAIRAGTPASFGDSSTSNAWSVALGAAASAGDTIICGVFTNDSNGSNDSPAPIVNDTVNAGNYTEIISGIQSGVHTRASVFIKANVAAGTPTITATHTGVGSVFPGGGICAAAFSGLDTSGATDGTAFGTGIGGTITSGNTAATTAVNELLVGMYLDWGNNCSLVEGSGFTLAIKHQLDSHYHQALFEYKDSGATGVQSAGLTTGPASDGWSMMAVVFKLAGGAATKGPPAPRRIKRSFRRAW